MARKKRGRRRYKRPTYRPLATPKSAPLRGPLPNQVRTVFQRLKPPAVLMKEIKNRIIAEPIVSKLPQVVQTQYRQRHLYKINPENLCRLLRGRGNPKISKGRGAGRHRFFYIRALRIASHCTR